MSNYTPGPWTAKPNGIVCDMMGITIAKTVPIMEEQKANAHLMAAAPDMLEALKNLDAMYNDFSRTSFDLVEIRSILNAAITKAQGKGDIE